MFLVLLVIVGCNVGRKKIEIVFSDECVEISFSWWGNDDCYQVI